MDRTFVIAAACCLVWPSITHGEEPPAKAPVPDCRELVRQLVSPNRKPLANSRPPSVRFHAEYDVAAQEKIDEARRALLANFEQALPFLFEALEDDRYCMTVKYPDYGSYNLSVGETCRSVLEAGLEVYREPMSYLDVVESNRYRYDVSQEWWESRKERSWAELQLEAVDWALKQRLAEGLENISERRRPIRGRELNALREMRDELKKTQRPVIPNPRVLGTMATPR